MMTESLFAFKQEEKISSANTVIMAIEYIENTYI